jgi:predicted O-methyltransferase YrrM
MALKYGNYMIKGIKNPKKAFKFLKNKYYANKRKELDTKHNGDIEEFIKSIDERGRSAFKEIHGEVRGDSYSLGDIDRKSARKLYNFILDENPQVIIETGVCNGVSTAIILKALEDTKTGQLYSIDLPEYAGEKKKEIWEGKGGAVIPKINLPDG